MHVITKSAWQPLLPSAKGLSFTFMYLLFMQESIVFSSIPFYFSLLQASCGGERSRHIYPVGYEWSWVIIVDITLEVNRLGGEIISPYLSMCLAETLCSIYMSWVLAIIEDYMMVEYVDLLKSSYMRPFLKIWWITIALLTENIVC